MPEIVIVDEIGTEAEALACRTIAERGVQLIGTAHGQMLENLIKNPTLSDLIGGICSVTLGAPIVNTCVSVRCVSCQYCSRRCSASADEVWAMMQVMRRRGHGARKRASWSGKRRQRFR